jgi:tetratricopeptide (TPR) repeat protein
MTSRGVAKKQKRQQDARISSMNATAECPALKKRKGGGPVLLLLFLMAAAPAVMARQNGGPGAGPSAAASRAARKAEVQKHLRRATEFLRANDANAAEKELNAVLAIDRKNAEAYANLGAIAFVRRDYQGAAFDLRKALAMDPSLTRAEALLGISERRLGDGAARALLEKAFPKLTDNALRKQVGMELADLYEREGQLDATASVLRALVELDPDNVDILFAAQRVYSELADDTLNKLAIIAPQSARMQQVIAEHLINSGDLPGAIAHYRKALEIDPRVPGVHYELGEAILESSAADPESQAAAQKEFEAAIQTEGDSAKIECQLGRIAFHQPDVEQAYAHFSRAFALNPADAEAQLGLGRVLAAMAKQEEAAKYLRMATASDPLNSEAHYRLAMASKKLGLLGEAEKEMRLFQEIKHTKDGVKVLYQQMNKKPAASEDPLPEPQP